MAGTNDKQGAQAPRNLVIPEDIFVAMLEQLACRPYREVHQIIHEAVQAAREEKPKSTILTP